MDNRARYTEIVAAADLENDELIQKAGVVELINGINVDGLDITDQLYTYELQDVVYNTLPNEETSVEIELKEFEGGVEQIPSKIDKINLRAGANISIDLINDFQGSDEGLEISAEKSRAVVQPTPPDLADYEQGDLWYNSTDGRLYIVYDNPLDPSNPTPVWIDASPAALNGGDFLLRTGDTVTNFFNVGDRNADKDKYSDTFFAQVYDLESLPLITDLT